MSIRTSVLYGVSILRNRRHGSGLGRQTRWAIIGIALSLVPLVIVLQVADGMIQGITSRYIETKTYHLQIYPFIPVDGALVEKALASVKGTAGVKEAFLERQGLGIAQAGGSKTGTTIRAISPELFAHDEGFRTYMQVLRGSFDLSSPDHALLGSGIAEKLGVSVDDTVKVMTARTAPNGKLIPKISTFRVKGIFSSGYKELDSLWMYIPFETGRRIFDESTSRQFIGVKILQPFKQADRVGMAVANSLGRGWSVFTWFELEKAQYKSFQTTKNLLMFIMVLIVCVAAVNISSSLVMLVIEKRQEIAILKSIGASPRDISRAFIFTGFLTGTGGTVIGIAIGLLASININEIIHGIEACLNGFNTILRFFVSPFVKTTGSYIQVLNTSFYLDTIPIDIDMFEIAAVAMGTILISTLASFFPARGAGRIRPLEVLRKY